MAECEWGTHESLASDQQIKRNMNKSPARLLTDSIFNLLGDRLTEGWD